MPFDNMVFSSFRRTYIKSIVANFFVDVMPAKFLKIEFVFKINLIHFVKMEESGFSCIRKLLKIFLIELISLTIY